MWRKRLLVAAGLLAFSAGGQVHNVQAADLGGLPPEEPQAQMPYPPAPLPPMPLQQPAFIVPPPIVIYGFMRPFPYRPYGCGGCAGFAGYPYYIPYANHPPSYYRPYYRHHLGLETDCDACGQYAAPGVSPGWGGYGYK